MSLLAAFPGDVKPRELLVFYPLSLTAIMVTEVCRPEVEDVSEETEEASALRQTFGRVDKNGDGRVNKADLLLAMKRMPDLAKTLRMSKSAVREGDGSMQEFERAFERLDRDQSGDLDWKEFSAVLVQE